MARFGLIYCGHWRRSDQFPNEEPVDELRPHIIGLDADAEEFLVWHRTQPIRDDVLPTRWFGPWYTGSCGSCYWRSQWRPSLRFKKAPEGQELIELLEELDECIARMKEAKIQKMTELLDKLENENPVQ